MATEPMTMDPIDYFCLPLEPGCYDGSLGTNGMKPATTPDAGQESK